MVEVTSLSHLEIVASLKQLRENRSNLLSKTSATKLQIQIVKAIALAAGSWLTSRESAPEGESPYPNNMVWYSLAPLLESLTEESMWTLVDREGVRGIVGPPLIGHIVASNTPLLATNSAIRALLVCSASYIKLPFEYSDPWLGIFLRYLKAADSEVAGLVRFGSWSRIEKAKSQALFSKAHRLIVYGDDTTVQSVVESTTVPILTYGHRVSAAIVTSEGMSTCSWDLLATDILLYDQAGCLSPHTCFIEGTEEEALWAADKLAEALQANPFAGQFISQERSEKIQEFRSIVMMDPDVICRHAFDQSYTIAVHKRLRMQVTPGHGIVYVVPGAKEGIIQVLTQAKPLIQGLVLASGCNEDCNGWQVALSDAGFHHVCRPGTIQQPDIHWRENGLNVLRSLLV